MVREVVVELVDLLQVINVVELVGLTQEAEANMGRRLLRGKVESHSEEVAGVVHLEHLLLPPLIQVVQVAVELWLLATTQQIPCPSLGLEVLL